MILRLTCPTCNKDSYSASVEKFKPCPYCGMLFSGKHGPDKRKHPRMKKEVPSVMLHNSQHLQACTVDLSERGLCVKIFGTPSLRAGETVHLTLPEAQVQAQVVWSAFNPEQSTVVTGLQIVE